MGASSLTANYSPIPAGTKPYITPPAAPVSSSRQGGDTFETAVAIDVLPYENAGTTIGYTADYGPYDDAVNAGLLCEYTGWLGNTGAAARCSILIIISRTYQLANFGMWIAL